jgi:hypothetical protein
VVGAKGREWEEKGYDNRWVGRLDSIVGAGAIDTFRAAPRRFPRTDRPGPGLYETLRLKMP